MNTLKGEFTRIRGHFSESRILPRLGKIRLGVKRQSAKGVQYPSETEYFVCPPEVQEVYGEAPTELDVILPSDDPEIIFPQKLAEYGTGSGLKCHGNGEQAKRLNEKTKQFEPCVCPCPRLKTADNPKGTCTEKSDLMVILPTVSMGGCYQIKTSSFHSTRNINSSLELIRAMTGRISMLPIKLKRVAQETHHDGKKQTHYVMNLILNATWQQVADLRSNPESLLIPSQYRIEAPLDENPELDPVDIIDQPMTIDAAELADMDEAKMVEIQAKLNAQREQAEPPKQAAPATIVDPAESKAEAPKAEPKPAEPAKAQTPPTVTRTWTDQQWADICLYFADGADLAALRDHILQGMNFVNKTTRKLNDLRQINPLGRETFMRRVAIEAERRGVMLEVK